MQTYYTEEIAEKSEISEAAEDMTFEEKRAEIMSYIRRMTLMDDAFMSMVLQDKECIELVHGIILERDDLEVMECTTQYTLANLGNRAARLDVMARDKNGKVYDIEVQNAASEKEIKRIRLYSALLDSHYLDKGDEPRNLPETYIIYIMGSDIYPDNLPIYHIDRTVRETGKTFEDELHIILVNSLIRDDTPLGKLMHDFHCIEPENMNYNTLNRHTCRYKEEMEETKMSELMEEYGAKRERRGEARVKQELIRNLLNETTFSSEKIAKLTKTSVEEVEKIDKIRKRSDNGRIETAP